MDYMAHHAIILTSFSVGHINQAYAKAMAIFDSNMVSNIITGIINTQYTFMIGPDGSEEGWEESDSHDNKREEFKEWLLNQNLFTQWAEVLIMDDDGYSEIVDNGQYCEEDGDQDDDATEFTNDTNQSHISDGAQTSASGIITFDDIKFDTLDDFI